MPVEFDRAVLVRLGASVSAPRSSSRGAFIHIRQERLGGRDAHDHSCLGFAVGRRSCTEGPRPLFVVFSGYTSALRLHFFANQLAHPPSEATDIEKGPEIFLSETAFTAAPAAVGGFAHGHTYPVLRTQCDCAAMANHLGNVF
jgi:hypothetical protein